MSDNQILYISSVLCFLLVLLSFKYNRQFAMINGVVFIVYNALLYYCLFYKGQGGSSFLWWFYLLIATILQILIVGYFLVVNFFKK